MPLCTEELTFQRCLTHCVTLGESVVIILSNIYYVASEYTDKSSF